MPACRQMVRISVGLVLSFNVYIDRRDGGMRLDFRMQTGKFDALLGTGQRIDGALQNISFDVAVNVAAALA